MYKIAQSIIEISKKAAIKNTEVLCVFWMHQPKVPAKLLAMKNAK